MQTLPQLLLQIVQLLRGHRLLRTALVRLIGILRMRQPLRLVAQFLLIVRQPVEIAHRLGHGLVCRTLVLLGHLQIFERVLQLLEHFLRIFAVAGIGQLLHAVEHRLQILPCDGLRSVG